MTAGSVTNESFAKSDNVFLVACKLAGIVPTRRQASKYRNARGLAYAQRSRASLMIAEKQASLTPAGIVVLHEQEVTNV